MDNRHSTPNQLFPSSEINTFSIVIKGTTRIQVSFHANMTMPDSQQYLDTLDYSSSREILMFKHIETYLNSSKTRL